MSGTPSATGSATGTAATIGPDAPLPALELDDVSAGYGDADVLHSVSVAVAHGETVGLIGPNGSGKTTVIRVAARGLAPRRGRVRVGGQDPYRLRPRESARLVAVVPQDLAPAFAFSALELVLLGRAPYIRPWRGGGPEDWTRARTAMEQARVQHLADRAVDRLSGGERRRVVLAQALAQDAPVLLLDEPTTHLDLRHVVEFLALVRALARTRGKGVLAVFHDLNLAAACCDRIVALVDGRVVASGTPSEVVAPDVVRRVFGVEAEMVQRSATGPPIVVPALPEAAPTAGRLVAHVIGGAGRGSRLVRRLAEAGFRLSVGVLHAGDTDAELAERLNLRRVVVPAFSEIDPASLRECLRLARGADVLVVSDPPFGPGNVANLRLAVAVVGVGVPTIVVEERTIDDRDFTGGEATRLWRELTGASRRIGPEADVARVAEEVATDAGARRSAGC